MCVECHVWCQQPQSNFNKHAIGDIKQHSPAILQEPDCSRWKKKTLCEIIKAKYINCNPPCFRTMKSQTNSFWGKNPQWHLCKISTTLAFKTDQNSNSSPYALSSQECECMVSVCGPVKLSGWWHKPIRMPDKAWLSVTRSHTYNLSLTDSRETLLK